jgi:glucose/arabinose dehydrogenase
MKKKLTSVVNISSEWVVIIVGLVLGLAGCENWFDGDDDDAPGGRATVVAKHLDTSWEMAFASDGRLFFSQRPGVIDVVQKGSLKVWLELDSVVEEVGESGLLGLVLHPEFEQKGFVHFAYTYAESRPLVLMNKIVRYKENTPDDVAMFDKVILDKIPGNYLHNVGALEFGPDGKL